MGDIWRVIAQGVPLTPEGKSLIDIYQASTGNRVYRVRRILIYNHPTSAADETFPFYATIKFARITDAYGGVKLTPIPVSPRYDPLPSDFSAGTDRKVTIQQVFRSIKWLTWATNPFNPTNENWELYVPVYEVWNAGLRDSSVQMLTCRPGYGICLYVGSAATTMVADFEIEFQNDAS